MNLILAFALTIIFSTNPFTNSTWILKVGNGCTDTIRLQKNNQVINYDCEIPYTFHGSYKISKDTLIIVEKDDSHSEDNGKVEFFRMKYLIRNNALYPIRSSRLTKGKWTDLKMEFDKNSFFKRIPN